MHAATHPRYLAGRITRARRDLRRARREIIKTPNDFRANALRGAARRLSRLLDLQTELRAAEFCC
jgi:hypothetical protein